MRRSHNHAVGYHADLFGNVNTVTPANVTVKLEPVSFPFLKRRRSARPTYFSRIPKGTNIANALHGATLLGTTLLPQGEEVAALLSARQPNGCPLYTTAVVLEPRRSAKTTSIWCEIVGRCHAVPGTIAIFTAQDGTRARDILRKMVINPLMVNGFEAKGLGQLRFANGSEAVLFANGSVIEAIPPNPSMFRSKAADILYFDEAGEYDDVLGEDLVQAAEPLMDTRPMAQMIVSGTPSPGRTGLLWNTLQKGITGLGKRTDVGVLAYMIRDDETSVRILEDGTAELDTKILKRVHPGIGTLTTLARIRKRFEDWPLARFEMEYLCRFAPDGDTAAITAAAWLRCSAGTTLPPRPDRVGIGYDVEVDGSWSAIAAAWRDADGLAHFELLDCRPGSSWLAAVGAAAGRKYKTAVAHDNIGLNLNPAQTINRLRARTNPLPMNKVQAATGRGLEAVRDGHARHHEQPDLTEATRAAVLRPLRGGALISRAPGAATVTPIKAAFVALWAYDELAKRPGVAGIITSGDTAA